MNLFIVPSWYPHRCHPFEGIYVRDQALAIGECRPAWHVTLSLWAQGRGHLTLAHLRRSPRCAIESLLDRRQRTRALRSNVAEAITPSVTWPARFAGGNREGVLSANIVNFEWSMRSGRTPDIIHAHVSYPAGWIAMHLSRRYRVPFVITEHMGPFPVPVYRDPNGGLAPWIREPLDEADERLAVSPALAAAMAAYGVPVPKVVPNLVDERLHPPNFEPPRPVRRFFTLCGMEVGKGVGDLIVAASQLLDRLGPEVRRQVRFRLGGVGPAWRSFQDQARALGVSGAFDWLGELTREAAAREYAACDCFVLASHHESFGIVLVEAMAHGKPVIATRCGGPESIVRPETGILVAPRQPTELAGALERMIAGGVAFDTRIIRSHFEGRYDRGTVVDQLDAVYQRVLSRSPFVATSTP